MAAAKSTTTVTARKGKTLLDLFPYTSVTLGFGLLILAGGLFSHIDIIDLPRLVVPGIEPTEMAEIVIAFLLVIPAVIVDYVVTRQRAHEAHLLAEQIRVLHVTVRTVQDIVNNNLNNLQLLRIEAEGLVSEDTLTLFDSALQDTAAELTALGNMAILAEKPMTVGSGLDLSGRGRQAG